MEVSLKPLVDASQAATLKYGNADILCPTLQEAIVAWHSLTPEDQRIAAIHVLPPGRFIQVLKSAACITAHEHKGAASMPTLSVFYGIIIQMFWDDHAPPHFHAIYAEHEALIDIRTLDVIGGQLPRRAMVLVLEWAQDHRAELLEDWELCARKQSPKKIAPLP